MCFQCLVYEICTGSAICKLHIQSITDFGAYKPDGVS